MNLLKYPYQLLLILLISTAIYSCKDDEAPTPVVVEVDRLDNGDRLFGRGVSELKGLVKASGLTELETLTELFEYDVVHYKVTYKTTYLGQEIIASGLVTFPETTNPVPMISFQNGTIASNAEAPTVNTQTFTVLSGIASAGYIFVVPDFIGFGASSDIISPYHSAEYTGRAVIDLMRAARELAYQEGYNFNGEAFLSGYSEGGYATMAAHKMLEEENPEGFELIASAPSSGGYDVKGFQEYFFNLDTFDNPFYMGFVALSYQSIYGYDDPLSDLFQEPYATIMPDLFDGSKNGAAINAQLTPVIADLLQPDILENIDTDPKYKNFVDALNDNTITHWIPRAKMFMYHGTADITVPYQNSVDSYNQLIDAGASTSIVTFIDLEGKTHSTGFAPYLLAAINKFEELK
ncbi:MAG TPA: lipase family protein [Fulvivirga sp.]|nr:lipase family protein [Fulvivirga sp.]